MATDDKHLPALPNSTNLPAIPDLSGFQLQPLPPSPLVGINPKLDELTQLALAGQTHVAAQMAASFQLQHQLLTYAMHLRNSTQDEITRKYLDSLIYHLMQVANQAITSVAATAVEQTRMMLLPGAKPDAEPRFSWTRFWLDPSYMDSDEYKQAVKRKSIWWRLWEDGGSIE
jgi:hypothetical protein